MAGWITINGAHVYIKNGQSVQSALNNLHSKQTSNNNQIANQNIKSATKSNRIYTIRDRIIESSIDANEIKNGRLSITRNANGIATYKFYLLQDANNYIKKCGFVFKKDSRIHMNDLNEVNELISAVRNLKDHLDGVKFSPDLMKMINPSNNRTMLVMPRGKMEGYCHALVGHREQYNDIGRIRDMQNLIRTAKQSEINKLPKPTKYGAIRYEIKRVNPNDKSGKKPKGMNIILDFINGELVYFNGFYGNI